MGEMANNHKYVLLSLPNTGGPWMRWDDSRWTIVRVHINNKGIPCYPGYWIQIHTPPHPNEIELANKYGAKKAAALHNI